MDIRELRHQDRNKAIQFAMTGMHFDLYLDNKLLRHLYSRYFWYMEMNRATQIIAAYQDDTLAGVLLAKMNGEPSPLLLQKARRLCAIGRFHPADVFQKQRRGV